MASLLKSPRHRATLPAVGTPKDRPPYLLRQSTGASTGSTSSLNSLFATASLVSPGKSDEDSRSLVNRAFVPHIAVHVSADTNELAREKGFADFKDLLRPYGEDLQGRVTIRDFQGFSNTYEDFSVRFVGLQEVASSGERWETGISRATAVNGRASTSEKAAQERVYVGGNIDEVEELLNTHLDRTEELIESALQSDGGSAMSGKFFYLFLRRLLSALPVSPHETFSHPVACVIAISSRNSSPIESLRNLYTTGTQVEVPAYVHPDYLRYYVLVHDEDRDDITKSTALFDQMKKHFGLHCHLLRLRSGGKTVVTDDDAVEVPTSRWRSAAEELAGIRRKETEDLDEASSMYLPETDASGLRTMVREMTQVSVVPFMERCIATWNDQVVSRRKGLSGRFLTMSKRYFGGSGSRNSATSSSNYDAVAMSYPPQSPEAQMRKLADFAFMLRDWKLANSVYDLLRTDFSNDKAWKYHAGAQEMTVISFILAGTPLTHKVRQETIEPMLDLACYSYLSRCSAEYCALRCLLVVVELLRLRGGGAADEAARWAIRARDISALGTVGHAIITERVGDCYAVREGTGSKNWGHRKRKSAMWEILAAAEWSNAGKNVQARHCLDESLGVYDKVEFSRVKGFLGELKERVGYAPLVEVDGDGGFGRVDSEKLELGSKRKSIIGAPAGEVIESEKTEDAFKAEDAFVDS